MRGKCLTIGSSDRGAHRRWAKEGVDDLDKSASFGVGAAPRRSTSFVRRPMKRRHSVLLTVAVAVAAGLGMSGLLLRAIFEVSHGRGAETYRNVYGLQIHWVSAITTLIAVALALLVALVARVVLRWRDRRESDALLRQVDSRIGAASKEQANE